MQVSLGNPDENLIFQFSIDILYRERSLCPVEVHMLLVKVNGS